MLTKPNRRASATLALLVSLGLIAAACGGGADTTTTSAAPGEQTTAVGEPSEDPTDPGDDVVVDLTFWTFVQDHADYMESRAAAYSAATPGVEVRIESTSIDWDDMHNRALIALQSGTGAPDLIDLEIGRIGPFLREPVQLHPLTDIVERSGENLVAERLGPYMVDGVPYGIDYHLGAYLMYYNTELTDAAGIDIDAIATWDDFIEAGLVVKEELGIPFTAIEAGGGFSLPALMLINGGGRYDASNNLILDHPANVEAAQLIQDMIFEHEIAEPVPANFHSPEFFESFNAGGAAAIWMPQWYMIRFPDNMPDLEGKIKVRPLPAFQPGGPVTSMGGGTGTAITNQIDPDKLEAAKDFLEYAKLTYEGQVELWTVLGFDPFWLDVYDDPALADPDPWFGNEPVMANIKDMLDRLVPEFTGPLYAEIGQLMGDVVTHALFIEGQDAAEVLADAQAEIEAME